MIFSIFMRKIEGDASPFPTTMVVQEYINRFIKESDIIITFPGYMSTTSKTINEFITNIKFPDNTYFTEGMNGSRLLTSGANIQDEHNRNFSLKLSGLSPHKQDHAKMIFFIDNTEDISNMDISQLLRKKVKAVLVGSSNQSKTTYFNTTADKGEADIFLFDGNFKSKLTIDNNIEEADDTTAINFFNSVFSNSNEFKERVALFKEMAQSNISLNEMFNETISKIK